MNKKVIIIISIVIVVLLVGGISTYLIINHNNEVNERLDDLERENKELKKDKKSEGEKKVVEGDRTADSITIPDLEALTEEKAKKILLELDSSITINIERELDDEIPEGHVIKTVPAEGRKVPKGSVITLYVSHGKAYIGIDDYTGKNYLEVKAELESRGLIVKVEEKDNNIFEKGSNAIIDQSVKKGERLYEGDSITLYISKSKEVVYPDFTDGSYTVEDVKEFCDKYGITLKVANTHDYEKDVIGKQSRPAGNIVISGSTLIIYVGIE